MCVCSVEFMRGCAAEVRCAIGHLSEGNVLVFFYGYYSTSGEVSGLFANLN